MSKEEQADEDEVWSDQDVPDQPPAPGQEPVARVDPLEARAQAHTANMQKRVLLGVGMILIFMFSLIFAAVWSHRVDTDFAREMARLVLPSLLGSGATIVGALFISGGRKGS